MLTETKTKFIQHHFKGTRPRYGRYLPQPAWMLGQKVGLP